METASINAFSVEPRDGFQNSNHSILFDHTLISAAGDSFPFKFRCGNIMALSAKGKGLSEKGKEGEEGKAKYMKFFRTNDEGTNITSEWVKKVNEIFTKINNNFKGPKNYKEIGTMKGSKYSSDDYKTLHDRLADALPHFLQKHIFSKNEDSWDKTAITDALIKNLEKQRNDDKYSGGGRIDKAYQLLFFNGLWDTQKFGGFNAGKDGPYEVFYEGLVDKDRKMIGKAETTLKEFIIQSLDGVSEEVGVLFLCESVQHLNEILGDDYTCVSIERDVDTGEIYSAIYKNDGNITNIQEVDVGVENNKEFGVFEVTHETGTSKVAVVHTIEKVKKSGKKVVGPDAKKWSEFITMMQKKGVNYIVGDTNMTAEKSKMGDKKKWWEESVERVDEAIVPTRKIKKVRLGDSLASKVNGFLNNQINKGGTGSDEVDGMVILKLKKGPVEAVDPKEKTQVNLKCKDYGNGDFGCHTKTIGGRRHRRRKTKRKRKRKPKKKTKRKRKRRTKKS